MSEDQANTEWHRVADLDELPDGRVKTITVGHTSLCLSHFEGEYGAPSNSCPHQGGPLGEGSIENGWLRCPWHGYDYHPLPGNLPPGSQMLQRALRLSSAAMASTLRCQSIFRGNGPFLTSSSRR